MTPEDVIERMARTVCEHRCLLQESQDKPCVYEDGQNAPCKATLDQLALSGKITAAERIPAAIHELGIVVVPKTIGL